MVLEMVLWTKPLGRRIFGMSPEQAKATAVLAANQGLYNGFLATGLVWSLLHPDPHFSEQLAAFFLLCVIAAGVYGAISVSNRIFFVQALPALLTLITLYMTAS